MKISTVLRTVYIITTLLCIVMASVVIIQTLYNREACERPDDPFLPRDMLKKYNGKTFVKIAHILPAPFWSICIPLQFHPGLRKSYPKFHKYLGRAFICTSHLLMTGVVSILYNGITFEHYVNSENDENPYKITRMFGTRYSFNDLSACTIILPFLYTAWVAIRYAKQRDYFNHKIWVMRHCSWGVWVMVQRAIVVIVVTLSHILYGDQVVTSGSFKARAFWWPVYAAIIITVGTTEYCIYLMKQERKKTTKRN